MKFWDGRYFKKNPSKNVFFPSTVKYLQNISKKNISASPVKRRQIISLIEVREAAKQQLQQQQSSHMSRCNYAVILCLSRCTKVALCEEGWIALNSLFFEYLNPKTWSIFKEGNKEHLNYILNTSLGFQLIRTTSLW